MIDLNRFYDLMKKWHGPDESATTQELKELRSLISGLGYDVSKDIALRIEEEEE